MSYFGRFYLDQEKDMIVELFLEEQKMTYILRTPNHHTGNLITNLAKLCHLPLSLDEQGLKVIRGNVPCYFDAYNQRVYIFRLGGTKTANIYPDGRIEMKASIPSISKTLMSQTKDYRLDIQRTIIKTYILSECKFRTDLHTHMNANLRPDILIALGIMHQIRYPLYYIKKLGLRCTPEQWKRLGDRRDRYAETFQDPSLTGKYRTRRIDDNTFINFADLILNNLENAAYNIPRIRASLAVMKDGQAVFTNLEKVYLYRYVFTKGTAAEDPIPLQDIDGIPDPDIVRYLTQMIQDHQTAGYRDHTLFQDKLLWIARSYQQRGIRYAEISDTTLVRRDGAAAMLDQVHAAMPRIYQETGVRIRFLAAIRRIPLTIIKDSVTPNDYLLENLRVLKAVAMDPYVAGSDIVGEEINDIRELRPMIREIVKIAGTVPGFVLRIHAGENDSLRDNVANSIRCVKESLAEGQKMPYMRIGHGLYTCNLHSAKGRQLIQDILDHDVTLEFQITSNVRLNNLSGEMKWHPLKTYLHAGIGCVQGTDGGALYGTDSVDEQLALEKLLQLDTADLMAIRQTEDRILHASEKAFEEKMRLYQTQDAGLSPGERIRRRLQDPLEAEGDLFLDGKKADAAELLRDQIEDLPTEGRPIVIAGGSFNSSNHTTRILPRDRRVIDDLLAAADPAKDFFVIGHRMQGQERYLTEQNQGRFRIYAFVPTRIRRSEAARLQKAGVKIRVSIEPSSMGLYKSVAFEIFKRRDSILIVFDGNSAGANLIQEARNAKYHATIYVNTYNRLLKRKALSLEGYVRLFDPEQVPAPQLILQEETPSWES